MPNLNDYYKQTIREDHEIVFGWLDAGSSPGGAPKTVTIDGLNLSSKPTVVTCQPRRKDEGSNQDRTEVFAVQVMKTSASEIRLLVRRVDANVGWGDQLRIDVIIFV